MKITRRAWTKAEEDLIIKHYNKDGIDYIQAALPYRTRQSIAQVAYRLRNQGKIGREMKTEAKRSGRPRKEPSKEIIKERLDDALERERKCRDYGIGDKKDTVILKEKKWYEVARIGNPRPGREVSYEIDPFKCKLIQRTEHHATFKKPNGVRESFLINDILLNEIRIKELEK